MKKLLYFAAFALLAFSLASCKKDDPSKDIVLDKGSYRFYELCLNWGADENSVKEYVGGLAGWKEDAELEEQGGLYFVNKETLAQMNYDFEDGELVSASIDYFGCNDKFDQMKKDISDRYDINIWEQMPPMSGVYWWSGKMKGKKTAVSIGYSDSYGGYMYASFTKTEFDF